MATGAGKGAVQAGRLDSFLQKELMQTASRIRLADVSIALLRALAWLLAAVLVLMLIDTWVAPLGSFWRLTGLIVTLGVTAAILVLGVLPPLLRRLNPQYVARVIEGSGKQLHNSLVNWLLFRQRSDQSRAVVAEALARRAATDLATVDEDQRVDFSPAIRLGVAVAVLLGLFVAYIMLAPRNPWASLARVLTPWTGVAPASAVTITDVQPGDAELFYGERLAVSCTVRAPQVPEDVRLVFSSIDGQLRDQAVPMLPANGRFAAELKTGPEGINTDLRYHIAAGDGRSPDYEVRVRPNPSITVQNVTIEPPRYTGLPVVNQQGRGDIRGIEGSRVRISATANQDIRVAWIELVRLPPGAVVRGGGEVPVVQNINLTATAPREASGEFLLLLGPGRTQPAFTHYRLRFRSAGDQRSELANLHPVQIIPDTAPEVRIVQPESGQAAVPLNGSLPIAVHAADTDFAISHVLIQMDQRGNRLLEQELELPRGDALQRVDCRWLLRPARHGLKEGDEVVLRARALDNRVSAVSNVPDPNETLSEPCVIRITAPDPAAASPTGNPERGRDPANPPPQGASGETPNQPDARQPQQQPGSQQPSGEGQPSDSAAPGQHPPSGDRNPEQAPKGEPGNEHQPANESQQPDGNQRAGGNEGPSAAGDEAGSGTGNENEGTGDPGSDNSPKSGSGEKATDNSGSNGGQASSGGRESGIGGESEQGSDRGQPDSETGEQPGRGSAGEQSPGAANQAASGGTEDNGSGESGNATGGSSGGGQSEAEGSNAGGTGAEAGAPRPGESTGGKGSSGAGSQGNEPQNGMVDGGELRRGSSGGPGERDRSLMDGQRQPLGDTATDGEIFDAIQQYLEEQRQRESSNPSGNSQPGQSARGIEVSEGAGKTGRLESPDAVGPRGNDRPNGDRPGRGDNGNTGGNDSGRGDGSGPPGRDSSDGGSSAPEGRDSEPTSGRSGETGDRDSSSQPSAEDGNRGERGAGSGSGGDDNTSAGTGEENAAAGNDPAGQPEGGSPDSDQPSGAQQADHPPAAKAGDRDHGSRPSEGESQPGGQEQSDNAGQPGQNGNGAAGSEGSAGNQGTAGASSSGGSPGNSAGPQGASTGAASGGAGGRGAGTTPSPLAAEGLPPEQLQQAEYSRAATDLVLQKLEEQRDSPDPNLLARLGWTEAEFRDFLRRWQEMKQAAGTSNPAAVRRYTDALRSLGLRPQSARRDRVRSDAATASGLSEDGGVTRPPPELAPEFNAFLKSRSRADQQSDDR